MSGIMDLVQRVASATVAAWWRENGTAVCWGYVTQLSPLRVRPTGQAAAVEVTPEMVVPNPQVGDRVLMTRFGSAWVVLGIDNGQKPVSIPGGANLNNYIKSGSYIQTMNVQAASGTNYPYPYAGLLEVTRDPWSSDPFVWQRYTSYGGSVALDQYNGAVWTRQRYSGGWTPWTLAHARMRGGAAWGVSRTYTTPGSWTIGGYGTPYIAWGDTSWRLSPADTSAIYMRAGTYRFDYRYSFARSDDGTSFSGTDVVQVGEGGYVQAIVISTGQPTSRFIGGLQFSGGSYLTAVETNLPSAVTVTSVSANIVVERLGPV